HRTHSGVRDLDPISRCQVIRPDEHLLRARRPAQRVQTLPEARRDELEREVLDRRAQLAVPYLSYPRAPELPGKDLVIRDSAGVVEEETPLGIGDQLLNGDLLLAGEQRQVRELYRGPEPPRTGGAAVRALR